MQTPVKQKNPGSRLGPRPLPLHLSAALNTWMSSFVGLEILKSGSPFWKGERQERAEKLRQDLKNVNAEAFNAALSAEIYRRLGDFLRGIDAYRKHPFKRTLADPPQIWAEGSSRLLDYGEAAAAKNPDAPTVFVIPSLVNRFHVLDLSAEVSFLRYLAKSGLNPVLMDWGKPGEDERDFTLSDYIAGRLSRALDVIIERTGKPPVVLGYCMGGQLALALALNRRGDISALVAMATPWDFHAGQGALSKLSVVSSAAPLSLVIGQFGELPVDMIQAMFTGFDPLSAMRKFSAFSPVAASNGREETFVALEDWLNDGVPLAGPVAMECLNQWYVDNEPFLGKWKIAGKPVRPQELAIPALAVIPERDHIVPPQSARALADALPGAEVMTPHLGHIGMAVSSRAEELLWKPLAAWIRANGGK